ncbi:MAG: NAD-dependent epimerase/dehydratase family protein [Candidatus Eisenbacteria bacterium]|nr:NAD-dependent epimerase/dehydratase family protein [Candidatus Latescibacterota bacterium]MBD3301631.1 NAD-dependent epimerase/dehydratase family protein [Candidatus Eisenbacteria bacterium]
MGKIVVTGGAGFIGSHAAIHFASRGHRVVIVDNLSRGQLLNKPDPNRSHNWDLLGDVPGIERVRGDVREPGLLDGIVRDADTILHAAAQTAVTTSTVDPETDFLSNALGTFRVLEAARRSARQPAVLYCSTNKVYGANVNRVPLVEEAKRYGFAAPFTDGIPEEFGIDLCEHTPYGCSKLTGDLYVQDFGHLYGLRVGVFRMSCIYGTRQFGMEDQGWVAWFVLAALTGADLTIFGDGRQVRDLLWVEDLVRAYEAFLERGPQIGVYNMGGGPEMTLSLLELCELLEERLGREIPKKFGPWRPSDQKVYVSSIRKARKELGWEPRVTPAEGVEQLLAWARENRALFDHLAAPHSD